MRRPIASIKMLFGSALALTIACATPTESLCGCPPLRSSLLITGTLADADGVPLVNTRFLVDSRPTHFPSTVGNGLEYFRTTASGAFRGRIYSALGGGPHVVTAKLVLPGTSDTIQLSIGTATFRTENLVPDSLRAELRIP